MKQTTLDLTKGAPLPLMLRFCLPILAGNLMQQFYNMADAAIVGKFVGTNSLAAVGATGAVIFLVIGFVDGMCAGFCIPVAQSFGAGDRSMLRRCIVNIIYLALFFSVILTAATSLLLRWMLAVMDFPPDIYADSYIYLRAVFLGIPATIVYNTCAGLMRAMGNSKTPLYALILSAGINIILDLTFVCLFKLAVLGAAIATVIAQIISGTVCVIYIYRKYPELHRFEKECERKFSLDVSRRLVMSGLPMALQYSITAIGSVLIQRAVNGLETVMIASVTAANKVQSFVHLPFSTLGVTISTWCGQNMGARDFDRVRRGFKCGMAIATVYSIVMGALMFFIGEYISLIFIDSADPDIDAILSCIRQFLRSNCLFYIPLGVLTVCRFSLQGLERGFVAMFAGMFEMAARGVVALYFATVYGFSAICLANPSAWIAACVLLVPACVVVFPKAERECRKGISAEIPPEA